MSRAAVGRVFAVSIAFAAACDVRPPGARPGDGRLDIVSAPVGVSDESVLPADADEILGTVARIMDHFGAREYDEAFAVIKGVTSLPDSDVDALRARTASQMARTGGVLGEYVGYDVAEFATQGPSLVRVTCIARFRNMPVRWVFVFYKPETRWILIKFRWDDKAKDGEFRVAG
jgi:hypothetical protein